MIPGDKVTQSISVTNSGDTELRYSVKSTTTENTLTAQLNLTIKTGVTRCTSAAFATDGTIGYGPGDLGSTAGINLIGNPAQGGDAGDRVLAQSASESLCLQVELPLATTSAFENQTTTATFTFDAEQTQNNP